MVKAKKRAAKPHKKKKVILPMKMSALIKIALKDIRKAERQPKKFTVEMSTWFDPTTEVVCSTDGGTIVASFETCALCAAGSIMAFSLGKAGSKRELVPELFSANKNQLLAVDHLRLGSVSDAARQLGLWSCEDAGVDKGASYHQHNVDIPDYNTQDPEPFHKAMKKLQTKLEKAGL